MNPEVRSKYKAKTIFLALRDAIKGTEMDYTQGSIGKAVFLLSVPMILEMLMESTFAVVDIYFVSKLGASAVATVGLTESLLTLMYAVAIGLAMGTTAMVSRRIGEKKKYEAGIAGVQSIWVAVSAAIPFAIAGLFFSKDILILMGGDEWTVNSGYKYTMWMLGGNAVIMLLFVINAIFRGAGDASIAMRVLILSNGINLILDPALILGLGPFPEMGVEGAAIATNIGRGTGVLFQLFILFRGAKHIKILRSMMGVNTEVMKTLVKTSIGGIGQFIIATSSWIFMVRIISEFGSEAVAGYTIAVRIFIFTIEPAWGMSNAAATLVGQNLGAGKPERAERSTWITGFATMFFLLAVSVVYLLFDEELIMIFSTEPNVVRSGADCLRIISYGYLLYAWGMVMPQAFNGAGDTITPTKINFVAFWLCEIPLAFLLAFTFNLGEHGVYWAVTVSESLIGILGIWLFRKGKWKQKEL